MCADECMQDLNCAMNSFHQLVSLASRAKREHWQIVDRGLFVSDHEMIVRILLPDSGSFGVASTFSGNVVDIPAVIFDRAPS